MMIREFLTHPHHKPAFLIAELGINHDGDIQTIKNMIDAAVESKADAVKFQLYHIDGFYNQTIAPDAYKLFESFVVSKDDFYDLHTYAEKRGIGAFASPFDSDTLHHLIHNKIFPIKIASGDALTEPWLDILLEKDIPFIISNGSLEEDETKNLTQKIKDSCSAMLYCVSEYPAPAEGFDIRYIDVLKKLLPNQAIGFSDHSKGIALSLAAVAHGSKIIERHFTLFPERQDLDHPLSLSPETFHKMAQDIRMIESALGSGQRITTTTEQKIRPLAGRDAYAKTDIPAQTPLTEEHIILQRPGTGITTKTYNALLGQKYDNIIPKGTRLSDIFSHIRKPI